jgi:RNA polymerase sigma factor (sigma-70 family)
MMNAIALRDVKQMEESQTTHSPALLAEYAQTGSPEALNRIIAAHGGLVHSACLRILNDAHQAEDAAQAVFLIFAQKARGLRADTVLPTWFYRTAVFVAQRARRSKINRDKYEREAAAMRERNAEQAHEQVELWQSMRPHIDEALELLPSAERDAVVLRYFCGNSESEAAKALACPIGTFSSRVTRGLGKLREMLRKRGIVFSVETIAVVLAAQPAPALAPSVVASIQAACIGNAGASIVASGLAQEVLKAMFWIKVKTVAAAVLLISAVTAGVPITLKLTAAEPRAKPTMTAPAPQDEKPPVKDEKPDSSRITIEPKVAVEPLYYERVTRTKFKPAKGEKNALLDEYIMDDFVDCQIFSMKVDANPKGGKTLLFDCLHTYAVVSDEVITGDKKETRYGFINVKTPHAQIPLQSIWALNNHVVTLVDHDLKFIPYQNAFVGTGIMMLNIGASGPVCTTGASPRAVGESWEVLTQPADAVKFSRQWKLSSLSDKGDKRLATINVGPSKFNFDDPEIMKGQVNILNQQIDVSLGVEFNGSVLGVYNARVSDGVVLNAIETITSELKLKAKLPDAVKALAKQMIGDSMAGTLTVEITDRLIDKAQADLLSKGEGAEAAVAECKKAWEPYTKNADPYLQNLGRFMLDEMGKATATKDPAGEF